MTWREATICCGCMQEIDAAHECLWGCGCGGDVRVWSCGCYGHKDCWKDGLFCQEHQRSPFKEEA